MQQHGAVSAHAVLATKVSFAAAMVPVSLRSGYAFAMQRHGHDRIRGRAHPAGAARIEFFKLTSHTAPGETLSDIGDLNYQFGWTADGRHAGGSLGPCHPRRVGGDRHGRTLG